jgi:hypothetical protein
MTATTLVVGLCGVGLVAVVLWDAFETVLVPRRIGRRFRLTNVFYLVTWRGWRELCRPVRTPSRREAWLSTYAPLSILLLLACWALALIVAFALLHFAAGTHPGRAVGRMRGLLYLSGQTFFTLGYGDITPNSGLGRILSVLEAGMGFGFLATVIGYLPTMYSAFSQREIGIALLDARAGSPPTAAEALRRLPVAAGEGSPDAPFVDWERWSAQLLETHISYPLLAYYRSQHSNQSWLAALTAMLDSCALILAGAKGVRSEQARVTFAMARHALVDVAQTFVARPVAHARDRLPPETLRRLREHLQQTPMRLPETGEFEERLSALRLLYEPYAQALAEYLLLELPPWIHAERRRDNWRGGPWDRSLGAREADLGPVEDHF